ncbi:hypothetical protein HZB02_04630 [Candidatus Woesearchaeota archaeon]|nr:hypothetical protein [Candidatus Woesearchaeota archaeon]
MNPDYGSLARTFLEKEKQNLAQQQPPGYGILLIWREQSYVGSLQYIMPEYSNEIVLLSKSSSPIPSPLIDAILSLQPQRKQISADQGLYLEDRLHVMRLVKEKLTPLTPDQIMYAEAAMPLILESNTESFDPAMQRELYRGGKKFTPEMN